MSHAAFPRPWAVALPAWPGKPPWTSTLLAGLIAAPGVLVLLRQSPTTEGEALVWLPGLAVSAALVTACVLTCLARDVVTDDVWPAVLVLSGLVAHLVTKITLESLAAPAVAPPPEWTLLVTLGALLGLVVLARLLQRWRVRPPALALGGGLGLALTSPVSVPPPFDPSIGAWAHGGLAAAVLAAYGLAALLVRRHWPWGAASRTSATVALLVLGAAQALLGVADDVVWVAAATAAAQVLAAGLLGRTLYLIVDRDLLEHRRRISELREQLLVKEEVARVESANRHALRNMVAGISMASEILEDHFLDESMRRRLEHTIHMEADQLRRLLDQNQRPSHLVLARDNDGDGTPTVPPVQERPALRIRA